VPQETRRSGSGLEVGRGNVQPSSANLNPIVDRCGSIGLFFASTEYL